MCLRPETLPYRLNPRPLPLSALGLAPRQDTPANMAALRRGQRLDSELRRFRPRRIEPAAEPQRRDSPRQAGRVIGLDKHAAQRRLAFGPQQPLARHLLAEPRDRPVRLHADYRIVIAAHADIG